MQLTNALMSSNLRQAYDSPPTISYFRLTTDLRQDLDLLENSDFHMLLMLCQNYDKPTTAPRQLIIWFNYSTIYSDSQTKWMFCFHSCPLVIVACLVFGFFNVYLIICIYVSKKAWWEIGTRQHIYIYTYIYIYI